MILFSNDGCATSPDRAANSTQGHRNPPASRPLEHGETMRGRIELLRDLFTLPALLRDLGFAYGGARERSL